MFKNLILLTLTMMFLSKTLNTRKAQKTVLHTSVSFNMEITSMHQYNKLEDICENV